VRPYRRLRCCSRRFIIPMLKVLVGRLGVAGVAIKAVQVSVLEREVPLKRTASVRATPGSNTGSMASATRSRTGFLRRRMSNYRAQFLRFLPHVLSGDLLAGTLPGILPQTGGRTEKLLALYPHLIDSRRVPWDPRAAPGVSPSLTFQAGVA
jgi:hypothetical protein